MTAMIRTGNIPGMKTRKPNPVVERIDARLAEMGISRTAACKAAGVNENQIKNMEDGRSRNPRTDTMQKFADVLGMSIEWLLHGKGEPPSRNEAKEQDAFHTGIPEIDVQASAGAGAIVDAEGGSGAWGFPAGWVRAEFRAKQSDLRIITVEGDSMVSEPPAARDIDPGDKVIVNINDTRPSPPGIFIVYDGFGLVAKRVQALPHSDPPTITISSNNPHYADYTRIDGEAHIVGRVVGRIQRL